MDIDGLMQLTSDDNREVLKNLINLKATVGEKYFHRKDSVLQNMAISLFEYIEEQNNNLAVNDTNYSFLDEFFLKTIYANSDNS